MEPAFRRADVSDCPTLSNIALRSKAYWGYDRQFMATCRPALEVDPSYVAGSRVFVMEVAGGPVGFFGFRTDEGLWLHDMWLLPERIGRGLGRRMWREAVDRARESGAGEFLIESDPFAEPFYLRMGCERIGETTSPVTGRILPLMRFPL